MCHFFIRVLYTRGREGDAGGSAQENANIRGRGLEMAQDRGAKKHGAVAENFAVFCRIVGPGSGSGATKHDQTRQNNTAKKHVNLGPPDPDPGATLKKHGKKHGRRAVDVPPDFGIFLSTAGENYRVF